MSEKVNDTIALFISKLSETTGYKYLKSRSSLKKTTGQIVFESGQYFPRLDLGRN